MSPRKFLIELRTRAAWYVAAKICLSLVLIVSATNITVVTTEFQAEHGGSISYTDHLVAVDRGISRIASNMSQTGHVCDSSENVTLTNPIATANTNLTASDYAYTIRVNATTDTSLNRCFSVTLTLIASGISSSLTLYVASSGSIDQNQAADCVFDIGPALPPSPYSFSVAVQLNP